MYKVFVGSENKARVCLDYINKSLVLPQHGVMEPANDRHCGFYLCFDGVEQYPITRDKVYNAIQDFCNGYEACEQEWNAMTPAQYRKIARIKSADSKVTN